MATTTEYGRIQNTKDRAALLVQLVSADARAMQRDWALEVQAELFGNYRQSRAALWALLEPTPTEPL